MTAPSVLSAMSQEQLVAIVGVDTTNHTATGQTRQRSQVIIDLRYLVGAVHVIPVVGEQWYIRRLGLSWALDRKLPYNTDTLATVVDNPVEGVTQIGSSGAGSGPLALHGSLITANAPLQLQSADTLDLPDASTVPQGAAMWDSAVSKLVISDGQDWRDTLGNVVLANRSRKLTGGGALTATTLRKFFPQVPLAGQGTLYVRAGFWGNLAGQGALSGVAAAKRFTLAPQLSGQGAFAPTTNQHANCAIGLTGRGTRSFVIATLIPYTTPGSYTYTIPAMATQLDLICIGGGGGGGSSGSTGASSTATIGTTVVTGAGGAGGGSGTSSDVATRYGQAAGDEVFDGKTYTGGTQTTSGTGHPPGGGGLGGTITIYYYPGGSAGTWAAQTVSTLGYSTVAIVVGDGGAGGGSGGTKGGAGAVFVYAY